MWIRHQQPAQVATSSSCVHPAAHLDESGARTDQCKGDPWCLFLDPGSNAGGARGQRIEFAVDARPGLPHLMFDLLGVGLGGFVGLCVDLSCIHAMFS